MILCISTSSAWVSAALHAGGRCLRDASRHAPQQASAALMAILPEVLGGDVLEGVVVDMGPGSFMGTRVGIVAGKTLALLRGVPIAGVRSFDLIDAGGLVVIPSKKGEFFWREPGQEPYRTTETPGEGAVGFGFGQADQFPSAARMPARDWVWEKPETFLPEYLIEPSISIPKRPYGMGLS